jgi:hypothetical protein
MLKHFEGLTALIGSQVFSVTRKLIKISPKIWKKWPKNAKISTLKLNLKVQNIYIKPNLKPSNARNKPTNYVLKLLV